MLYGISHYVIDVCNFQRLLLQHNMNIITMLTHMVSVKQKIIIKRYVQWFFDVQWTKAK